MILKYCPFCGKQLENSSVKCFSCNRTIVETVYNKPKPIYNNQSIADNETLITKYWANKTMRAYLFLGAASLFLVIGIMHFNAKTNIAQDTSILPNHYPAPTPLPTITEPTPSPLPTKNPSDYISLSNGKILYSNPIYLNGEGEISISNGTITDAVVKLVNVNNNKSIFTTYIKANNKYTIKEISDGNYLLVFSTGLDWNSKLNKFNITPGFTKFDESFYMFTTEYKYTTFEVTLNPVVNGKATIEYINPDEFSKY